MPIVHDIPDEAPPAWLQTRWAVRVTGPALLAIGALSELFAAGGGLYWIDAGIVFASLGAVANAWVLLVEILRSGRRWIRAREITPRSGRVPPGELARMGRCADPINVATPSSPATSGTSPGARSPS